MRVVSSELDPHKQDSDVSGTHTVLYPSNDAEVNEALVVAKVLGVNEVLVRSGRHAANNEHVDGTGALVVNLRNHCRIEIDGNNSVTVCAGATTSDLAIKLKKFGLFLPLDGDPGKSVFSNARSTEHGFVPAFHLGSFLTGTSGINKKSMEFVDNVPHQDSGDHIVTKMVFKAKTAEEVNGYRMTRLRFAYDQTFFGDVLRDIFFGQNKVVVGDEVDVRVTVLTGAFGLPMFVVTVLCPHYSDYITKMIKRLDEEGHLIASESAMLDEDELIGNAPEGRMKVVMETETQEGVDIVEELAQEGKGSQYFAGAHRSRYSGELTEDNVDVYLDAVHRSVATSPTPILRGVKLVSTTSWKAEGDVARVRMHMSLHAPLPKKQTSAEKKLHNDVAEAFSFHPRATVTSGEGLGKPMDVGKLVGFDAGKRVDEHIPGFCGEVYHDGEDCYDEKVAQYATSSYKDESVRMRPCLIGYPEDTADVLAFVKHAIENKKKVVVRSGGHQYCGLSSGNSDTMLLSMGQFTKLEVETLDTGEVVVQVGPGAPLTKLAAELSANNVTIPHGECINVCIGGHVQTGGYGHIMRSYGLALDYVKSFDIVLAEPLELCTITRPTESVQHGESSSRNDRIFWGVLGGGAGSFGVITNVEFECIKDLDHPYSCGYSGTYFYHKAIFRAAMMVVKQRTVDVCNDSDRLPKDCDLMVTCMSGNVRGPCRPRVVSIEMIHGNCAGLPLSEGDIGLARMKNEIDYIKDKRPYWWSGPMENFTPSEQKGLSAMSEAFVRNSGMTEDGREFKYPYVKRVNCTTKALTEEFVEAFVDLCHRAMRTRRVRFVFQMVMGGGAYKENGDKGITSIPHRDIVIGIVFDCFHFDNDAGKTAATKLHREFGELVGSSWGEDIRMMWGSFGETDMDLVNGEYYGRCNGLYKSLQDLKKEVDPLNHFHTPFTVQLPKTHTDDVGIGCGSDHGVYGVAGRSGKRTKRSR